MTSLIHEIRCAVRTLLKQPGFTLVAVVTLALGIGANVAIFAVVNGMLLQPLPYGNQARVLSLNERSPMFPDGMSVSLADYLDWRERQQGFESMVVFQESAFTLTGVDEPERISGTVASTELLSVLGVTPISGRGFRADDGRPGAEKVVLIGYGLWQRRFGGEPIVGRTIELDREPHTVIGVMANDFGFPEFAHLWVPLRINPAAADTRGAHAYQVIGLLKPGVSEGKARTNLATIARQLEQAYPKTNTDIGVLTAPLRERSLPGELRLGFVVFMAVVAFVLLIACANIANLLLGRAVTRDREMAVRVALGAGRWRILRLLMAESLLVAGQEPGGHLRRDQCRLLRNAGHSTREGAGLRRARRAAGNRPGGHRQQDAGGAPLAGTGPDRQAVQVGRRVLAATVDDGRRRGGRRAPAEPRRAGSAGDVRAARAAPGQWAHRGGPDGRGAAGAGGPRAPHDP